MNSNVARVCVCVCVVSQNCHLTFMFGIRDVSDSNLHYFYTTLHFPIFTLADNVTTKYPSNTTYT